MGYSDDKYTVAIKYKEVVPHCDIILQQLRRDVIIVTDLP